MDGITGYTLLRRLGEGERAQIWLAQSADDTRSVALKIFAPSTSDDSIAREIGVLARLHDRHLLRLDDVGTASDSRPFLVLPRLRGPSLFDYLAHRRSLSPGEVVTVLAPIVAAVAQLQAAGIAHGGIRASSILVDEVGAPVLVGFGRATQAIDVPEGETATVAQIAGNAELALDRASLCDLVTNVAAATHGAAAGELIEWAQANRDAEGVLSPLLASIYALAESEPLRQHDSALPERDPAREAPLRRTTDAVVSLGSQPTNRIERARHVVEAGPAALVARARELVAGVRRPVWIAGGLGGVALLLALVLIPSGSRDSAISTPASGVPATPSVAQSPSISTGAVTASPQPTGTGAATSAADDPVAAARRLFAARARCLERRSATCLSTVDQDDSSALDADRERVSSKGSINDDLSGQITLVERLGDTAIVGVGAPVPAGGYPSTVLLVKTDDGWRIRGTITGVVP